MVCRNEANFFTELQVNLNEYFQPTLEDCVVCKGTKVATVKRKPGELIFIDVSWVCRVGYDGRIVRYIKLTEISENVHIGGVIYKLVGVIKFVNGNHFVPYTKLSDGTWDEKDDMQMDNVRKVLTPQDCDTGMILNSVVYVRV